MVVVCRGCPYKTSFEGIVKTFSQRRAIVSIRLAHQWGGAPKKMATILSKLVVIKSVTKGTCMIFPTIVRGENRKPHITAIGVVISPIAA
jgi:molybdopterin synthase catalytic subunit